MSKHKKGKAGKPDDMTNKKKPKAFFGKKGNEDTKKDKKDDKKGK